MTGDDRLQGQPLWAGGDPGGYAVVRGLSDQLSSARGNDAGARRGGRSLNTQSLGSEVCPDPGQAIPGAEASGRVQLANGRDLCADQGRLEVSVSRGRQGRCHGGLPVDGQTGSQGGAAFLTQGDRTQRYSREDYDRQERRQDSSDRKPQQGS